MFASALAMAQSSVTLYGVLGVFAAYQNTKVSGKTTSLVVLGNNGEMTSRWGLRLRLPGVGGSERQIRRGSGQSEFGVQVGIRHLL